LNEVEFYQLKAPTVKLGASQQPNMPMQPTASREIVGILTVSAARSRRLMGRPFGGNYAGHNRPHAVSPCYTFVAASIHAALLSRGDSL
jgi:hypothetical protein